VVNFLSKPVNFCAKIRGNSRFFAKPPFLLRPHNPYSLPILTDLGRPKPGIPAVFSPNFYLLGRNLQT